MVLRLYPLLSVEILYFDFRAFTINYAIGVFPVPPIAKFPIQINGKLKVADFKILRSNKAFRTQIIIPYTIENGNNKYLKLFSNLISFNLE